MFSSYSKENYISAESLSAALGVRSKVPVTITNRYAPNRIVVAINSIKGHQIWSFGEDDAMMTRYCRYFRAMTKSKAQRRREEKQRILNQSKEENYANQFHAPAVSKEFDPTQMTKDIEREMTRAIERERTRTIQEAEDNNNQNTNDISEITEELRDYEHEGLNISIVHINT